MRCASVIFRTESGIAHVPGDRERIHAEIRESVLSRPPGKIFSDEEIDSK
jgi:hypothetical protein